MKYIDAFLNRITMYRLVTYGLGGIALVALFLATFGVLAFDPVMMIGSLLVLLLMTFSVEWSVATLKNRPINYESWAITALILFLIMPPANDALSFIPLAVAGALASGSKLLLIWRGKHIFNPAAFAAAALSLTAFWPASWWVGSHALWWATLIVGLLVIRKVRHTSLVVWFVTVALGVQAVQFLLDGQLSGDALQHALIASPLIFLATIMLTEPATMPGQKVHQYIFVTLAAVLFTTSPSVGGFYVYPEVALLIANLYAFIVTPKATGLLRLKYVQQLAPNISNYVFEPKRKFRFTAGQYMEWTLPGVPLDARGNRRAFTIASSPTENEVMLGVKFYEPSSAYKQYLRTMQPGDHIYASQVMGHFTLPKNSQKKILLIAGGIGVTPFRSIIKSVIDSGVPRDIVLLYAASDIHEFAYSDLFLQAREYGLRVHFIVTKPSNEPRPGIVYGPLDEQTVVSLVPDLKDRTVYVSGPNAMVDGVKQSLKQAGLQSAQIKTDYFSGY